ncbi:hypothetical protein [Acinetobacter celticus]|uniref:Uncharacterized protein n=1 Tax=Acinetobacter celticus TaxID=1891224 RepID=A0A1C3CV86_9GAMM|nr:hypothetical protein [Acinetobacter celticus]ODA12643.1 hypothetical protein BBP83_08750 [Acinetobacter celticus]
MNILNGTEAFTAMSAGQKIECRHVGSDLDFDDIRNFSATVFIDQDHEFRIAVIYMMIGAMQVPEAVKDTPAKGVQCFCPSLLTTELSKAFKWRNSDSDLTLLERGLVHLYEENAITHARALVAVSLGLVNSPFKNEVDLPWDDEEKTSTSQSNIEIISQGPIAVVEDSLTDFEVQEESTKKALDDEYKNHLNQLLDGVSNAKTPAEVNAHTRYTKKWSEEQRKPLLDAIHKRLNELAPDAIEIKEPPSLLSQIQSAEDLTALDVLEIDVASRHVDIQPKLMDAIKKRKFELENQSGEVVS